MNPLAEPNDCCGRSHTHSVRYMNTRVQWRSRPIPLQLALPRPQRAAPDRPPGGERPPDKKRTTDRPPAFAPRPLASRHPSASCRTARPRQRPAPRDGGRSDGAQGGIHIPWAPCPPRPSRNDDSEEPSRLTSPNLADVAAPPVSINAKPSRKVGPSYRVAVAHPDAASACSVRGKPVARKRRSDPQEPLKDRRRIRLSGPYSCRHRLSCRPCFQPGGHSSGCSF